MGIFNEVQRQFIARPDEAKDQVVYKWPDKNIRKFTQLTVQQDELAVFFKDGKIVGTLGAGRHNLDGKDIPFIGLIIDALTGGNILISELYFVSNRELTGLPFGGQVDTVVEGTSNLAVELRLFGEYSMKVTDPEKLILTLVGTQNLETNEQITEWVKSQVLKIARSTISNKVAAKEWEILGIARYHEELEKLLTSGASAELEDYGVTISRFGNITISMKEEDATMLKQLKRDTAYANTPGAADAALKVGIGKGMEKGGSGTDGVGLGVGIAVGADLLKKQGDK